MASVIDKIYKEIGESDFNQDVKDWLDTGLKPLNKRISGHYNGGFPVGRITEIYGGPSCGKTLLATNACIETQKRDGLAIFLDHEHAFSLSRGRKLGLSDDKNLWIYKQPTTAEESFKIIEYVANMIRTEYPDKYVTIIEDSVASMVTEEELNTEYGDENMRTRNSLPMLMSTALKKLSAVVSKTNITLIFLNQTRDNPGVMFGSKEKTPGGNSLKFYASVRIRLSKRGKITIDGSKDGEIIGETVKAQTVKNKVYEPFKECDYTTHFKNGINLVISHIDEAVKLGIIEKSGAWYNFEGCKVQGKDKLIATFDSDPALYEAMLANFVDEPLKIKDAA